LRVAESSEPVRLEIHHVDEPDEVHAAVVEAVIALVGGGLAETAEIFGALAIGDVVLAGHGVKLSDVQSRHQLRRGVEFLGFRKMGDIARVNGERWFHGHGVDEADRLLQRPGDIGIGFLAEPDMRVADLEEQRDAADPGRVFLRRRHGQVEWRKNAA
jgi:hypothetical protein